MYVRVSLCIYALNTFKAVKLFFLLHTNSLHHHFLFFEVAHKTKKEKLKFFYNI